MSEMATTERPASPIKGTIEATAPTSATEVLTTTTGTEVPLTTTTKRSPSQTREESPKPKRAFLDEDKLKRVEASYVNAGFQPVSIVDKPADAINIKSCIRLRNGVPIPIVGFGTYKLKGDQVTEPTLAAFEEGYVLVDSAQVYDNEKDIGKILKDKARESFFIETKLWRSSNDYDRCMTVTKKSIRQLKVKYLDLYIIHWPGCKEGWPLKKGTTCPPNWTPTMRNEAYRAMEDMYLNGEIRAIGVSNFSLRHLKDLMAVCRIVPHVLQIEYHPMLIQQELYDFCQEHGIVVQGFASLGSGDQKNMGGNFFKLPGVEEAAKVHGKTPAQVLLRWGLEKGLCIVPKSCNKDRIIANTQIFDFSLSKEEIAAIDVNNQMKRLTWNGLDPNTIK